MAPSLTEQFKNPQGFSDKDLAAMNTASQQSIGGSVAGTVGQGNLEAARTRNAGGFTEALDEAARSGQRQNSQNAVGIAANNALEKEKNKNIALAGLTGIYGQNVGATLGALGLSNQALGVANQAQSTIPGVNWGSLFNPVASFTSGNMTVGNG